MMTEKRGSPLSSNSAASKDKDKNVKDANVPGDEDYLAKNKDFTLYQLPLSRQVNRMVDEFMELERHPAQNAKKVNFTTSLKMMEYNRYSNIAANEPTLFPPKPNSPKEEFLYINGNSMKALNLDREFVACQAPVPAGINTFLHTIAKYGVSLVLMVTKEIENGFVKANRYWPDAATKPDSPDFSDDLALWRAPDGPDGPSYYTDQTLQLTYRNFCIQPTSEWRKRQSSPAGKEEAGVHRVRMIQYLGWPDHGVPSSTDSFRSLLRSIEQHSNTAPIIVHCSAGVGRTATLIGSYAGLYRIRRGEFTNGTLKELVIQMRECRFASVQRVEQYMFMYEILMAFMGVDVSQLSKEVTRRAAELQEQLFGGGTR